MKIIIINNDKNNFSVKLYEYLLQEGYSNCSILEKVSYILPNHITYAHKGNLKVLYKIDKESLQFQSKSSEDLGNLPELYKIANIVIHTSHEESLYHLGLHGSLCPGEILAQSKGLIYRNNLPIQNKKIFYLKEDQYLESIDILDGQDGLYVTLIEGEDKCTTQYADYIVHHKTNILEASELTKYLPIPHENYIDARGHKEDFEDIKQKINNIYLQQFHFLLIFIPCLFFLTQCAPGASFRGSSLEGQTRSTPIPYQQTSEDIYQNTPVITQFLMPLFPEWINFNSKEDCKRKGVVSYLNYSEIKKQFDLTYVEFIRLQGEFHLEKMKNPQSQDSALFYASLERVRSNVDKFYWPTNTHTIIIVKAHPKDEIKFKEKFEQIKRETPHAHVIYTHPCFFSFDLTHEKSSSDHVIGMEYYSPYNEQANLENKIYINWDSFLLTLQGKKQKIIFLQ